jgi:hypothetical protein
MDMVPEGQGGRIIYQGRNATFMLFRVLIRYLLMTRVGFLKHNHGLRFTVVLSINPTSLDRETHLYWDRYMLKELQI